MDSQFSFKIPVKKKDEITGGIFAKASSNNPFTQTSSSANPFRIPTTSAADEETKGVFSLGSKESTTTTNPFAGNAKPSFLTGGRQNNDNLDDSANKQKKPLFASKTGIFSKDQTTSNKITRNPFTKFESTSANIGQKTLSNPLVKPALMNKWFAPTMEKNERQRSSSPYREKNESSETIQRSHFMDRIEKIGKDGQNTAANTWSRLQEKPSQVKKHPPAEIKPFTSAKLNTTSAITREMSSIIAGLVELKSRHCPDDYSRYTVLDERDKLLYRWRTEMEKNSPRVGKKIVTGTLQSMCAEKERYVRVVQKRIASYECDINGEVESSRLVKEYSRSAADQEKPLPHELRKPEMLRYTMNYLLTNILDGFDPSSDELGSWYNFLWDRTRAIRKEITQLMLSDELAVSLLESCTRFHIICAYLLCSEGLDKFDQKMNTENLGKSLQTLRHLYEDLAKKGIYCQSEAEFRSYDVLLHLQDSNVLRQVLSYRKEVREDKSVRLSIQLASAIQTNNFTKFFRLLRKEATYLQCCICHRFFTQVRSKALAVMARSYGRNPSFNIQHLCSILAFDGEKNALDIMGEYGIYPNDMNSEEVDFTREHLNTDAEPQMVTYNWIDLKNCCRLSETVNGGPVHSCTEIPIIFDSFDISGYYTQDPIMNEFLKPYVNVPHETVYSRPEIIVPVPVDPTLARRKAAEEEKRKYEEEQIKIARDKEIQLLKEREDEARRQEELMRLKKIEEEKRKEFERMKQEELRKQELRRQMSLVIPSMYEKIEAEVINGLLKSSIIKIISRHKKDKEICRIFVETASNQLITSVTDEELKQIIKMSVKSRRKEVEMTLSGIRTRLSLLWLRQFWDQWRAHVEMARATRKRRSRAWEEFIPSWNSSCFSPDLYINSSRPKAKENRPPLESSQLLALAHIKRKRFERISRRTFELWRSYAREKSFKRKQEEILIAQSKSFLSRRSNDSETTNDMNKLKRLSYFDGGSPIRKSARLTLEESFSFPTHRKNGLFREEMDETCDRNAFETSVLTEEDVAIARRELERSSFIWEKIGHADMKLLHKVDTAEEDKNETKELFGECLEGQRRFQGLKSRATDLAESIREHQSFMNSLLDTVIHKRNSILDPN